MAYVFDLSMDSPFEIQNDVPVTVIRSKAEVVDRAPVSAVCSKKQLSYTGLFSKSWLHNFIA